MSALGTLIQHYLDLHPDVKKKDIAKAAGVSPQSVSGWINGTGGVGMRPENIIGLAQFLGVPAVEIVLLISQDQGIPVQRVEATDLPPELQVTLSSLKKLSPDRLRTAGRIVAGLVDEERQAEDGPKTRGRRSS